MYENPAVKIRIIHFVQNYIEMSLIMQLNAAFISGSV